ncbi:4-hydroxy-tetrahydrodipicolinate synthase [Angelakisella massiliensis]|uniref:4-hydroxy-tetrahydrodipicolinate synthase n=1 Tax=Angelakisella massiliensis TaxID=1871018 RepID=UPI0008F941A0|nr:4-hydroxy-tetrahydrodipicolinate synthase [Angelakisella massiliensis]
MKETIFTGSGVAIVTPMREDRSIDYEELGRLIDFQLDNGTDALIICGTTGESSTMTDEEHVECIAYAVKRVAGRVPVIAGAGSNDTAYAIWVSKEAEAAGADALLQVTPYYNKATQKGLVAHFTAIADATTLPIILYNVPSRTGVNIKPETYLELSRHPRIVAAKEASGDLSAAARTARLCGDALTLYSGNDDQVLPILSLGGKGVISVLANVAPRETHEMVAAYLAGETAKATALQLKYIPLIEALFSEVNPIPVKEALNLMGFHCGPCRLPLTPMEEKNREKLAAALKDAGLLG